MIVKSLRLRNIPEDRQDHFPWTIPLIKNLEPLNFESNISFFVGENGSGKSTILEAIASYTEVPLAGSFRFEDDESLAGSNELAEYLSIRFGEKTRHGFFVRAEDFIGFSRHIKSEIKALDREIKEVTDGWTGGDLNLAIGAIQGEKNSLINRYSADMEAMSHGEGFLKFFTSRITSQGLYLIDEPEAALSPTRQLSLLSLIQDKVKTTNSHFIIATHSPILMCAPESELFYFQDDKITKMDFKETEHFQLTKAILTYPESIIDHL